MDKDRQEAKERVRELSFTGKIKHYWGYYKYPFLFAVLMLVMVGYALYGKITEVDPVIEAMIFSNEFIGEETEKSMEDTFSKWLGENYADGVEYPVNVTSTMMFDEGNYDTESVIAANTKLTAVLGAEQATALIFDEKTYIKVFVNGEFDYLENKEYSGEIGGNGKKLLGLDENMVYYYVTAQTKNVGKGNETAVRKFENSKIVYNKLKELN